MYTLVQDAYMPNNGVKWPLIEQRLRDSGELKPLAVILAVEVWAANRIKVYWDYR